MIPKRYLLTPHDLLLNLSDLVRRRRSDLMSERDVSERQGGLRLREDGIASDELKHLLSEIEKAFKIGQQLF